MPYAKCEYPNTYAITLADRKPITILHHSDAATLSAAALGLHVEGKSTRRPRAKAQHTAASRAPAASMIHLLSVFYCREDPIRQSC